MERDELRALLRAVAAGQVAGLGGLPDHDERGPVEVQVRAGAEGFPVRMPCPVRMGMRHVSTLALRRTTELARGSVAKWVLRP